MMPTPPHPEYPAGHPTIAAAAAYVLERWFNNDTTNFVVYSDPAAVGGGGGGGGGHAGVQPLPAGGDRDATKMGGMDMNMSGFPVGAVNQTYADAATAAGDAAASRVWAGAHYPATVLDTLAIARAVAAYTWDGFTTNIVDGDPFPLPPTPTGTPVPGSAAAVRVAVGGAKAGLAAAEEEIAGFFDAHKGGLGKGGAGHHGGGGGDHGH
jgi:hypothetical protein